ncbi:MAG: histidinol-phosphatase [Anaerotignum sp.]|nr:histidinol-phosphatase [Anaerotignum sp.]
MIPKMNFHTHTTFCDGKNTAEEMVLAALEKGFAALGFSGHSYTYFDESYCMSKDGVKAYQKEIERLKEVYAGKIALYCGIEQDFYSEEPVSGFEYAIGSVHYIKKNGKLLAVDEAAEIMEKDIQEQFGGDPYAYAKVYFETVAEVLKKTKADIIGHFDLLTKFNEKNLFFDTKDRRYYAFAISAIEALIAYDRPFEINTGAIYRGLRSEAYPSVEFLKEINKRGGKIILSSDSHDCISLGYRFEKVARMALEIGFPSTLIWTPQGFEEVELKERNSLF